MKKKSKKYLVDTSAVPPSLGESTPAHCAHFQEQTSGGSLWTSVYIRKEFIHRWIRYYIRLAAEIDHFTSVSHALDHLQHDFGRSPKIAMHAFSRMLEEKGEISNCQDMAIEFARLAYINLRKFDRKYKKQTGNRSGCKLGGKQLKIDFNHLFDDLRAFDSSVETASGCQLSELLRFGKPGGAEILTSNERAAATDVVKKLEKLSHRCSERNLELTCKHCRTIGDAVIALEQTRSWCLLHVDESFNDLCDATDRDHKQILSERAAESRARSQEH